MPDINSLLSKYTLSTEGMIDKRKDYNKTYAYAVKCFQERINKDRKKAGQKPLPFMAIKTKLSALKEIDDLRAWYKTCVAYSYKKDKQGKRQSFSKCFFGGTKVKS